VIRRDGAQPSATDLPKLKAVGRWRRLFVQGLLVAFGVALLGRSFWLQVLDTDYLRKLGDARHVGVINVDADRGAIRDRRGEPLALSAPVSSIWALPGELLSDPTALGEVARLLDRDPRELQAKLKAQTNDSAHYYLAHDISPEVASQIMDLKAPGVFADARYRRFYPAGEITAQLVGFAGVDGVGQEGMEAAWNQKLTGEDGYRKVIRDAKRRVVEDLNDSEAAVPGKDLRLTIDLRLQYLAYRELKAAVTRADAKGGVVVIADALNGDILAIASQPGFNPNNNDERDSPGLRMRAITDLYEPGSTIKPLLISHALDIGAVTPATHFDTGKGWYQVGSLTIRDTHAYGDVDLGRLLEKSSNIGAAKLGLMLGAQTVWEGYESFGLGEKTGVDFPGEVQPVLRPYSQWGSIATATASYGYGVAVTAMTMVRAYCAIAHDGLMPQLRLVDQGPIVPPRRVISAQTARTVRTLLQNVVTDEGTARRAAIPGYRVAGKTGTVHKVSASGGYSDKRYQGAFIGMVPAESPRLVGLVLIDEPTGDYYGGAVAAPVFSTVMQGALRLLQIAPDQLPPQDGTGLIAQASQVH